MMEKYFGAMAVFRVFSHREIRQLGIQLGVQSCSSKAEAEAYFMDKAVRMWPPIQGWVEHVVKVGLWGYPVYSGLNVYPGQPLLEAACDGIVYHSARSDEQLPKHILEMEYGLILFKHDTGLCVMDVMVQQAITHAEFIDATDTKYGDFDTWTRMWMHKGAVGASFQQAGTLRGVKDAERKVRMAVKAMIDSGFNPDIVLNWEIEEGVTLHLTLGDA